ncbi:MAG: hypothetical protein ACRDWT_10545, partial [Jatrophihabitantaceae bacterium]
AQAARRKSRMDQRTRERLPALPALTAAVEHRRSQAADHLAAARAVQPGQTFTTDELLPLAEIPRSC